MNARNLMEGAGKTIADQSYVGALIQKWGQFLEGIPDRNDHERYVLGCTAMMLENESLWLQSLNEDTRSVNVGSFVKFIFPVLRRVFPNLIAHELVSVQPMSAPIGAVFFLDYVYGNSKGTVTSGDVFPRDFNRDYSSEFVNGEHIATGDGVNFGGMGTALSADLSWTPVRPLDAGRGFSVILRELNATTGATVQEAIFTVTGATVTGDGTAGTLNHSNGAIASFLFTAAPVNGNPIRAYYYYDGELNTKVPEVRMDIKKSAIEAIPRRLKAIWSSEAAEDLRALHGLDAENELVSMISQQIGLEIDRDVINDLDLNSLGTTAVWDRIPAGGITELDHFRSLLTQITTVSKVIHTKTLRAPANWMVTSPYISALLAQLQTHGDYKPIWSQGMSPDAPMDVARPMGGHGNFAIYKAGTLLNKMTIYEDPFFTSNRILVGLKGGSFLEAGYAWAPYIPIQITPSFQDPADFSVRKGIRTRYGKKLLRPDYYGSLTVTNL